ncbi:hypothetical protein ACWFRB_01120 [Rhodococcus sp. NPDC055112]
MLRHRRIPTLAITTGCVVALSACSTADVTDAASQLSARAQQAVDDSVAARDVLSAENGMAAAAAACELYAGWEGMNADVRSALAPVVTDQLERYTTDSDPVVASVVQLTIALVVDGGVDANQALVARLQESCRAL